jgi:hypothetical protein
VINLTRTCEAGNVTRSLRWLTTDVEELQGEWGWSLACAERRIFRLWRRSGCQWIPRC